MTGTRPAHDTRFSSSNLTSARRHGCDNLTGSASLTDRCWILRKPIIAGQEALSCQPRRRREWSFGGLRLRRYVRRDSTNRRARCIEYNLVTVPVPPFPLSRFLAGGGTARLPRLAYLRYWQDRGP